MEKTGNGDFYKIMMGQQEMIAVQDILALIKKTKTFVENRERAGHIKVKGQSENASLTR